METARKTVTVSGHTIGPVHTDETGQNEFRFFDVFESRPNTRGIKGLVIVYPNDTEPGELSHYGKGFWSETGDGDLPRYLTIHGTFEKTDDDNGNPFAGVMTASKVVVSPSRYSER